MEEMEIREQVRGQWEALGDNGQFEICVKCTARAAKRYGFRGVNPVDYAGAVWLRVVETLESGNAAPLPLLVARCAVRVLAAARRQDMKYAAAEDFTIKNGDGDELGSVLDLVSDSGSVEAEAIVRVDFSRFYDALDALDQAIIRYASAGDGQEAIAAKVGKNQATVSRRLRKMRARYDG